MVGLAAEMPGFISINGYAAEDGSGLAVVRFESDEDVKAWKAHPDHVEMTVAGSILREYRFPQE